MNQVIKFTLLICLSCLTGFASEKETFESLTLSDAIHFAMNNNPEFAEIDHQIQMADAEVEQAGLWPNPILSGGMEAITPNGSDADPNDPEQRQDIIEISQSIPLGGVLQKAQRVSELERERLEVERERREIIIASQVKSAYYEVIYYQEILKQWDDLQEILNDVIRISNTRLEQGDIAEIEVIRVEANQERFSIESEITESKLVNAKIRLANLMGNPSIKIGTCQGALESNEIDIQFDLIKQKIEKHPRSRIWDKRVNKAHAEIEKAKADSWPSLEISTNYRRFDITDQHTVDIMVAISIPIFNRNQGIIRNRKENLQRENATIQKEKNKITERLKTTWQNFITHKERVQRFRQNILPKIEETSRISQQAYSEGDVSILDVLDSYRSLAESRLTYMQELYEMKKAVIQLESLIGSEL